MWVHSLVTQWRHFSLKSIKFKYPINYLAWNPVRLNVIKSFIITDPLTPLLSLNPLSVLAGSLCEAGAAWSVPADRDVEGREQNSHPVQSQCSASVWISVRFGDKWVWGDVTFLSSVLMWLLCTCLCFIQVKETDAVVLAGAYVDLHGPSTASPENLSHVRQCENPSFEQQYCFFSFI